MILFLPFALFAAAVLILPCYCSFRGIAFIERRFARMARTEWKGPLLAAGVSLGVNVTIALFAGLPPPSVHDEFSYLLAGDTYAHGRLTNPHHPLWKSIETFHVLQFPTRQSKYPPAQGLFLALGQLLTGHPIFGVWLSMALACAAIVWLIQGWLPSRWALLGGVLTAINPMLVAWGQCYWGGGVPLLGGALLFGGWRRALDRPSARTAIPIGLGISLLLLSRPFEGGIVSLIALISLWLISKREQNPVTKSRGAVAVIAGIIACDIAFILLYNTNVTGKALHLPYAVYESRYGCVPVFLWQTLRPISLHDTVPMAASATQVDIPLYQGQQSPVGFVQFALAKLIKMGQFCVQTSSAAATPRNSPFRVLAAAFGWMLIVPSVFLPQSLKQNRRLGYMLPPIGGLILAVLSETWFNTHYNAPVSCLVALLLTASLRNLYLWRNDGKRVGRAICRITCILILLGAIGTVNDAVFSIRHRWGQDRINVASVLKRMPGDHIVFVSYGPRHNCERGWENNEADIDRSRIVWARDLTPEENARVRNYYPHRHVWLLYENGEKPVLTRED